MRHRSTVIKAGQTAGIAERELRQFKLDDILHEVLERVTAARAQAAEIIANARTDAERIRQEAREEGARLGREEGYRQGREAGRAEGIEAARVEYAEKHARLVQACERVIEELSESRATLEASARSDLIELATAIARRVARHVGQRDREVVRANLNEAIRLAGARTDVTVFVSPADAATAREFGATLMERSEGVQHVKIVEDNGIAPGGCRLQWGSGGVDARLETQLDRIAQELEAASSGRNDAAEADPE
jgi:flagellar assembly protein FliH